MNIVAALYVCERGPYMSIPGVDAWPESRDATKYAGPLPIVAHPACGPWCSFRKYYTGYEGGPELGIRAVEQVRAWGGVLEQPRGSGLFKACGMPRPDDKTPDAWGGYTVRVSQSEWGHACKKPTWLYCVRVPREAHAPPPFPGRPPTHWIGSSAQPHAGRGRRPPGIKSAHKRMRILTPPLFAMYLLDLAASVQP